MLPTLLLFSHMHPEKCSPSFAGRYACLVFTGDTVLLKLLTRSGSLKSTEDPLSTASVFDESIVLAWKEVRKGVGGYHLFLYRNLNTLTVQQGKGTQSYPMSPHPARQMGCSAIVITSFSSHGFQSKLISQDWIQSQNSLFSGGE